MNCDEVRVFGMSYVMRICVWLICCEWNEWIVWIMTLKLICGLVVITHYDEYFHSL